MRLIQRLWADESGASAAEYALILAIIGGVIAVAAVNLGDAISGAMNGAATCINEGASCGAAAAPSGGTP